MKDGIGKIIVFRGHCLYAVLFDGILFLEGCSHNFFIEIIASRLRLYGNIIVVLFDDMFFFNLYYNFIDIISSSLRLYGNIIA